MKIRLPSLFKIFFLLILLFIITCSKSETDSKKTSGNLYSGPLSGGHYDFAPGIIASTERIFGILLKNQPTNGSYENIQLMIRDESAMGLVLEDTFTYAVKKGIADNNLELIAAAAKLKVLMVAFYSDVYILVNKNSGINSISDLAGKKVSIAEENSGTYITARTILDTYTFSTPPVYNNDSTETALQNVINGTNDALIKVTADSSGYFGALTANDNVKFIRAELAGEKALYDHTGIILKDDFPFQLDDITGNIRVRVLLVGTPDYEEKQMDELLGNIFANKDIYAGRFSNIWDSVTAYDSIKYFGESPYAWNYKCAGYFTGIDTIPNAQTNLVCGTVGGSTEIIAGDLLPLILNKMGLNLTVVNTSGSPEMAINIADGSAAMAIVLDDVYEYLNGCNNSYDYMTALSLKKIMPLFKEEVHVLVNTGSGINTFADLAGKKICVCEKTSGSFIVARNILRTYGFTAANAPTYYFESPETAVAKVVNGTYDAIIKVSAQPYSLFTGLNAGDPVKLIPARVKDGTISTDYETGTIAGGQYPFQSTDVTENIFVRSLLVVSPAVSDVYAGDLIDAVHAAIEAGQFSSHAVYWTDVTRDAGLQYFRKKPYGWSQKAAEYYLSGLGYQPE